MILTFPSFIVCFNNTKQNVISELKEFDGCNFNPVKFLSHRTPFQHLENGKQMIHCSALLIKMAESGRFELAKKQGLERYFRDSGFDQNTVRESGKR